MKVFASCDSKYFTEHADAFIKSAKLQGMIPQVNIINPTEEQRKLSDNIVFSFVGNVDKTYYSYHRFLIASMYAPTLVTDIDCYFNKSFPEIKEDIGIFLRENESFPGMKVAAGLLWVNNTEGAQVFMRDLYYEITQRPSKWYVDQYALYATYLKFKNDLSFFYFDNTYMDWEFKPDSYMWTGKGPRKYRNSTYLNKKAEYESIDITS